MILFETSLGNASNVWQKQKSQMGMIAVLHTWGQNLSLHPHLHCIVPGGGVDENGLGKTSKVMSKFLFSVKSIE